MSSQFDIDQQQENGMMSFTNNHQNNESSDNTSDDKNQKSRFQSFVNIFKLTIFSGCVKDDTAIKFYNGLAVLFKYIILIVIIFLFVTYLLCYNMSIKERPKRGFSFEFFVFVIFGCLLLFSSFVMIDIISSIYDKFYVNYKLKEVEIEKSRLLDRFNSLSNVTHHDYIHNPHLINVMSTEAEINTNNEVDNSQSESLIQTQSSRNKRSKPKKENKFLSLFKNLGKKKKSKTASSSKDSKQSNAIMAPPATVVIMKFVTILAAVVQIGICISLLITSFVCKDTFICIGRNIEKPEPAIKFAPIDNNINPAFLITMILHAINFLLQVFFIIPYIFIIDQRIYDLIESLKGNY